MTLPHLDDDQLNAHLDGEDGGAGAPHLAGCGECAARLAELRAAQAAVRAPIAPPADVVRDAAIIAALDAWTADEAGPVADHATTPVPLRRSGTAVPRWLVAAAVLVVLGLVAVPFVRMGGDGPSVSTAERDRAAVSGAGGPAPADLGAVDSDLALNDRLRAVLGVPGPADAGGTEAANSFSTKSDLQAREAAPALLGDGSSGGGSSSAGGKAIGSCQPAATKLAGEDHTTMAFSASLIYRGTPGFVFVFIQQDGDRLSRRAVVLDRSSCSLLVVQSF